MFQLGFDIASRIARPLNFWLIGPLGAGKTVFAKGLLKGIGASEQATSPSYLVAKEYIDGRIRAVHLDLFRMSGIEKMRELGLLEYFDDSWLVICEWADRLENHAEYGGLIVRFEYANSDKRTVEFEIVQNATSSEISAELGELILG
ncbi:MAG: tRNA (adenosine(37)-N6)-threonylcarbamoyltransferase complex ATPase subunit type 1 TsaE [bacterium]|jgi:tRNA threonylcarbamoyladenosine biosynthesis protein TsaE